MTKVGDAENVDYSDHDVVILSIYITNKDVIIRRILESTKKFKRLIIINRHMHGLSQYFYKNYPITSNIDNLIWKNKITSGIITSQAFCLP